MSLEYEAMARIEAAHRENFYMTLELTLPVVTSVALSVQRALHGKDPDSLTERESIARRFVELVIERLRDDGLRCNAIMLERAW